MSDNQFKHLALLRGINVGGKNIISKDELRGAFEAMGFTAVRTYIQSGNILFRSEHDDITKLTSVIEKELSERFAYTARAVVLSHAAYESVVAAAPAGWGSNADEKHNALFVIGDATSEELLARLPPPKSEIETVTARPGVIFWSIVKAEQTKTTCMKLPASPVYKQVTIRNHNTTFKLLKLFEEL